MHIVGLGKKAKHVIAPKYFFELLGGQLGIVSPILFVFMVKVLVDAWKKWKLNGDKIQLFLFSFCVVYAGPFFLYSFRKRVFANWPVMGYITAVILIARWYVAVRKSETFSRSAARKWFSAGLWLSGSLTLVLYLHLATGFMPIKAKNDPLTNRFAGWPEMTEYADILKTRHESGGRKVYLYAKNYQYAALMAFYGKGNPMDVMEVKNAGRPNQYDLWGDLPEGSDAILVFPSKEKVPDIVYRSFEEIVEEKPFLVRLRGHTAITIRYLYCRHYNKNTGKHSRE